MEKVRVSSSQHLEKEVNRNQCKVREGIQKGLGACLWIGDHKSAPQQPCRP